MRALLGTLLGTMLLLAACAEGSGQGPTSKNATAGKSEPRMICREEAPTGSLFTQTVCRSPEQMDQDRTEGQEFMRRQRGAPGQDNPLPTVQQPSSGPH